MNEVSTEYKVAMKEQISVLFQRFSRTYQNLWAPGNPRETAELMAFWITELYRQGIKAEQVQKHGFYVTDANEFSNYPPKPVQLAKFILDEERKAKTDSNNTNGIEAVVEKLCTKWRMIYGNLFCSKEDMNDIVDFWTKEIVVNQVSAGALKKAYYEIRKQAKFRTFPPTLDAFIFACKMCESGLDASSVPEADEAYMQACNERHPHPLVREARRRVGSYEVRTQSSPYVRKAFERAYDVVIQEFCSGDLKLDTMAAESETSPNDVIAVDSIKSSTLSSTIEDILSRMHSA